MLHELAECNPQFLVLPQSNHLLKFQASAAIRLHSPEINRDNLLPDDFKSIFGQKVRRAFFIYTFQQSGASFFMSLNRIAINFVSKVVYVFLYNHLLCSVRFMWCGFYNTLSPFHPLPDLCGLPIHRCLRISPFRVIHQQPVEQGFEIYAPDYQR